MQCADLLVNFDKYKKFNVRTPKGLILEGPPGNGKTLLAKCFSGEIDVSFIPVSGAQFQEKYVGVGASRIRELFKLAVENKPCVIFIDEIDALGRKRAGEESSSNAERDNTLNELLVNLDGFKSTEGIFLIGSTNRLDLLDPALTRPGRIDKSIYVGNPGRDTREKILNIHIKGKPYHKDINTDILLEMTQGFSGAQIENLLNEAMLYALRENREMILVSDLEYIVSRILVGWQSSELSISKEMLYQIAVHEMGHAVVGVLTNYKKLIKVSLNLWSPKTPGYTLFETNEEDSNMYSKDDLITHLMVLLGGRIAEEELFNIGLITTGASHDLEEAKKLAEKMVLTYGMGNKLIYPFSSDKYREIIDNEIKTLLEIAQTQAKFIIINSKDLIDECAKILAEEHILTQATIMKKINNKYPYLLNIKK
jgi:cell division protease FtsH